MLPIRIAMALACALPFAAMADIGPKARELLDINKKMAEPTCDRVRLVLEAAIAREKGETDRVKRTRASLHSPGAASNSRPVPSTPTKKRP